MRNENRKSIKRLSLILLIITLFPVLLGAAPAHTENFYVNDYADVLSDQTEAQIMSTAVALFNETTAQVCVLTIDSLDGEDISEYSVEVFRDWGIGNAQKDNGVLILLSISDREMWVTTGYGVEGTLTDVRLGQFRDTYAFPYYKEDNFDKGTLQLFNAIVNELRVKEYGLDSLENFTEKEVSSTASSGLTFKSIIYFAMAIYIVFPPVAAFLLELRATYLGWYDKKHGTQRAIAFNEKSAKIKKVLAILWIFRSSKASSRHGSSRRGGGFGGGGGGFRGGGGSTGGGGAGGRF